MLQLKPRCFSFLHAWYIPCKCAYRTKFASSQPSALDWGSSLSNSIYRGNSLTIDKQCHRPLSNVPQLSNKLHKRPALSTLHHTTPHLAKNRPRRVPRHRHNTQPESISSVAVC